MLLDIIHNANMNYNTYFMKSKVNSYRKFIKYFKDQIYSKVIIVKTIQSLSSVRISNIISFFHVKTFFILQHSGCSSHDIQHFLKDVLHPHHTMA